MLDAFIIEKIQREREQRERPGLRLPLERPVERDRPLENRPEPRTEDEREGGAIIVDFTI